MTELDSTVGIVAVAAAAVAAIALLLCVVLAVRLRRMGAAQRAVLGDGASRDLVEHASQLSAQVNHLAARLADAERSLTARADAVALALEGAVSHTAVVRYDALNEMTGRQSSSVALLDDHRTGVVISSILQREQARLYAKRIVEGGSEQQLSPEEEAAIAEALGERGSGGAT